MSSQDTRKRRKSHKRSRNGCSMCKARHVRCDEQQPICTNCIERGGTCTYPTPPVPTSLLHGSANPASAAARGRRPSAVAASVPAVAGWSLSVGIDPFDSLPIEMPHNSHELFHHYTHFRIFSRTAVPKNSNNTCVGMAMQNPLLLRTFLLVTAMHHSWLHGNNNGPSPSLLATSMEQTYLYHRGQVLRTVSGKIGDPAAAGLCAMAIAGLLLAEAGIGHYESAEMHLQGLDALLGVRRGEVIKGYWFGLVQRGVLLAGSFIAAARRGRGTAAASGGGGDEDEDEGSGSDDGGGGRETRRSRHTRATTRVFSSAGLDATDLSPFYWATPPDMECCNADIEGEMVVTALRRLSGLPVMPSAAASTSGEDVGGGGGETGEGAGGRGMGMSEETTAALVRDTDAFISSLLFRPSLAPQPPWSSALERRALGGRDASEGDSPAWSHEGGSVSDGSEEEEEEEDLEMASRRKQRAAAAATATSSGSSTRSAGPSALTIRGPFPSVDPALIPSSSRAWATAGYLYLHIILRDVWPKTTTTTTSSSSPSPRIDQNLLRFLVETLREDVAYTEEAMTLGAYSNELWLWKSAVAMYCLDVAGEAGGEEGMAAWAAGGGHDGYDALERARGALGRYRGWFGGRVRRWARVTGARGWRAARSALGRIVWPEGLEFEGNALLGSILSGDGGDEAEVEE